MPSPDDLLPPAASHGYLLDRSLPIDDVTSPGLDGAPIATSGERLLDVTRWSVSWARGAGAMWATVDDLMRWAAAGSGSDLLPHNLATERLRTTRLSDLGAYGIGLQVIGPWIGHSGATYGWESIAIHNRSSGATFVAAVNASGPAAQHALITLFRRIFPSDRNGGP